MMDKELIFQPDGKLRLGDFLKQNLDNQKWEDFRAAVAFIKHSGTKHIQHSLAEFAKHGKVKMTVGIDADGTSIEGLTDLLEAIGDAGEIRVFHNANISTFHPKIYLFKNQACAEIIIGSANLTEGGFYTNYEAGVKLVLDRNNVEDNAFLTAVEAALDHWNTLQEGLCYPLTKEFLQKLIDHKYVSKEADSWKNETKIQITDNKKSNTQPIFKKTPVSKAPKINRFDDLPKATSQKNLETPTLAIDHIVPVETEEHQAFVMTLQRTDVGAGQTTKGTSRRSPEIFIPLIARNADPEFWGWPNQFIENSTKPGKMDRVGVKMRIGVNVFNVNMMTWPDKHDFRLRSEHLRSAGQIEDILYIERSGDQSKFDYHVEIIQKGSVRYQNYLERCIFPVKNSNKFWGYI